MKLSVCTGYVMLNFEHTNKIYSRKYKQFKQSVLGNTFSLITIIIIIKS